MPTASTTWRSSPRRAGSRPSSGAATCTCRRAISDAAARARAASTAADLEIASYGSYAFALGLPDADESAAVLDAAVALGAPNVRVWAGFGVAAEGARFDALAAALAEFAAAAAERGLTVGLEYHGGTATATVAGTLALLDAVGAPNLASYWQPPYWRGPTTPEADAAEIASLGARLSHLHVYEWAGPEDRRPLVDGAARWARSWMRRRRSGATGSRSSSSSPATTPTPSGATPPPSDRGSPTAFLR